MPTKPLRLFIRPPYTDWTVVYGYGLAMPGDPQLYNHTLLRAADKQGSGALLAAVDGKLSVRPPGSAGAYPAQEVVPLPARGQLDPTASSDVLTLYLHPSPILFRDPAFIAQVRKLNNLVGFAYIGVDPTSLEDSLAELLDSAVLPRRGLVRGQIVNYLLSGTLDVPISAGHVIGIATSQGAPEGTRQVGVAVLTDAGPHDLADAYDQLRLFVADKPPALDDFLRQVPRTWPVIDPDLSAEEAIALTKTTLYPMAVLEHLRASRALDAAKWRQVGNNQKRLWQNRLLVRVGHAPPEITDPPFEFDDLDWQNIFQLEAVVEFYANFDDPWRRGAVPNALVGSAASVVMGSGNEVRLDRDADLTRVRASTGGSDTSVSDTLWLKQDIGRESRRYRITAVDCGKRTVALDGAPNLQGPSAWRIDLDYITVDFLDPAGAAARVVPGMTNVIQLDGDADLTRVRSNRKLNGQGSLYDTLYLEGDTARPSRRYRIMKVDTNNRTFTLDGDPSLDADTSAWEIRLRPVLVLIDSFGGRIAGTQATVANSATPNVVTLDHLPNPAKINPYFDTIYLPADANPTRPLKTYRITDMHHTTVTLDGTPVLENGSSAWRIPAGVSGKLPKLDYNLGPGESRGYDHYDGVLFVVQKGHVSKSFAWCSYTSHNYPDMDQNRSSVRGNARYDIHSWRAAGNDFINYGFLVVDAGASVDDGIREARFYFDTPVTPDQALGNQKPVAGGPGKVGVFLHYGLRNGVKNGSAGCLVSPAFYALRDHLIDGYNQEYRDFFSPDNAQQRVVDQEMNRLYKQDRCMSSYIWQQTFKPPKQGQAMHQPNSCTPPPAVIPKVADASWNDKIIGSLWLIRPDERPLG